MIRRRVRPPSLEEPNMNLTPLIDVVFVILITFIVVAPLLELDRIELAQGYSHETTQAFPEKSPLVIQVQEDNSILVNQIPVPLAELEKHLAYAKQRFPDAKPQVFHDQRATFGTYQSIKNCVEKVGFSHMDVILKPE